MKIGFFNSSKEAKKAPKAEVKDHDRTVTTEELEAAAEELRLKRQMEEELERNAALSESGIHVQVNEELSKAIAEAEAKRIAAAEALKAAENAQLDEAARIEAAILAEEAEIAKLEAEVAAAKAAEEEAARIEAAIKAEEEEKARLEAEAARAKAEAEAEEIRARLEAEAAAARAAEEERARVEAELMVEEAKRKAEEEAEAEAKVAVAREGIFMRPEDIMDEEESRAPGWFPVSALRPEDRQPLAGERAFPDEEEEEEVEVGESRPASKFGARRGLLGPRKSREDAPAVKAEPIEEPVAAAPVQEPEVTSEENVEPVAEAPVNAHTSSRSITLSVEELRKFDREELIELLLSQTARVDKLEEELAAAKENAQKIALEHAEMGTMSEAALKLNRIFEDADRAARIYLENIRKRHEND